MQPYQLRTNEIPEDARKSLNDILGAISERLNALEAVRGVLVLPSAPFRTGGTVTPSVAPFPLRFATPKDFTPVGLVVLGVEVNPTALALLPTSAVGVVWRPDPQGNGLLVDFVSGLSANTQYRLTLGAIHA